MLVKLRLDPHKLTELLYLAKTIWAEARSEGIEGMRLVAWVIRNRVESKRWPDTYHGVTTQRSQFSAWLRDDPNYPKMADPLGSGLEDRLAWFEALRIADEVMDAPPIDNPLPGVYHYYDVSLENDPPYWSRGKELIRLDSAPKIIFVKG